MKDRNIHKRQRYIRFFISSTFADMTRERNLLQELFRELSETYRSKGWSIEYVDLRWGITNEIGTDNRTMRICLDELKRCQQLSPKPNFIILSGQRRGWIPLPEILTKREARRILWLKGRSYEQLFKQWYKLDSNQLPEPVYILQPRKDRYTDEKIWQMEVYSKLIAGMRDLSSATEQEIQQGAMNVADSADHVIAYIRDLTDIPASERSTFIDNDLRKVDKLRRSLADNLNRDNIYQERLSFSDYDSDDFAIRFKQQMSHRLTSIINNVIDEYGEVESESERYRIIAAEKYNVFCGRQDTLEIVDRYIQNSNEKHSIWFRGKLGVGKSSLIAELSRRYSDTHHVICRFCGETEDSSKCYNLLSSIWEEMREYYPIDKRQPKDLPKDWEPSNTFEESVVDMFKRRLRNINSGQPLLILIDGMDQLAKVNPGPFFDMEWISGELSPLVKVILTSTEDDRFCVPQSIQQYDLNELSPSEAMQLVSGVLSRENRTITDTQMGIIKSVIANSDQLPVYLDILGHFLCKFASYDELPELSSDLNGLMGNLFDYVTDGDDHDYLFVRMVLSLLVCDRQGLSQDEILKALSIDELFMEHLKRESHHEIVGDTVPPILWTRLFDALSFIFGIRHVRSSSLFYIQHQSIKDAIRTNYLEDTSNIYSKIGILPRYETYSLLAKLYDNIDTPHALMEAVYCNYMAVVAMYNANSIVPKEMKALCDLMRNPHYIQQKLQLDRTDLLEDTLLLNTLTPFMTEITADEALSLRKDIASLKESDWDEFVMQCYNLHSESYLRTLLDYDAAQLSDKLKDLLPYDLMVSVSSEKEEKTYISNDGMRALTLKKRDCQVVVEQMDRLNTWSYSFDSPIELIDVSADLMIHAIVINGWMLVYDVSEYKTIERNNEISDVSWVSLSEDGATVAYGNSNQTWVNTAGLCDMGGDSGKLSNSGKFLWLVKDGKIRRIQLSNGHVNTWNFDDSSCGPVKILAADDCNCVVKSFIDENKFWAFHMHQPPKKDWQCYRLEYGGNCTFEASFAAISNNRIIVISKAFGKCLVLNVKESIIDIGMETTLTGISAVSRNGQYAFSIHHGLCYNLPQLLNTFSAYETDGSLRFGINTIATDSTGSVIVVTCGKNGLQEYCPEYLLIDNGAMHKMGIKGTDTCFFISCAVSPDGNRIWLSELSQNSSLFCVDRSGKILAKVPGIAPKISMRYTPDGKFLVALSGHHFVDANPRFDIIDENFRIVDSFEPEGLNDLYSAMDSDDMELSEDGRYAFLIDAYLNKTDFKPKYVVDLQTHCLLGDNEAQQVISSSRRQRRFSVSEDGLITYHNPNSRCEKKTYLPDVCKWVENDVGLAAVTRQGRVCFFNPLIKNV